jgi:hypothetical protein
LTEEHKLRVCENVTLSKIFGSKRDEVAGDFMTMHNEVLHDLYSLPDIFPVIKSRKMKGAEHVACMGKRRGAYRVLVGKSQGKRQLGRPRRRTEENIKIDVKEICWEGLNWFDRGKWRAPVNAMP